MSEKIKVIICEDHAIFRTGIKSALQSKEDIEIIGEAVDGQDLLRKLNYLKPDIILLDINMPKMDGMTVLPILKATDAYKDIKVIILTMHNQPSMVSKMMSLGANSFLTKGDDSELIYEAIVTCYNTEYYFNKLTNESLLRTIKKNPDIIDQDEELKEIESNRQKKIQTLNSEVKNNDNRMKENIIIPKYIVKGVITGTIAGIAIIFLILLLKALSNNLSFNNFTP
jgi:DNA-binding NarL/FixJ family response regulator